MVTKNEYQIKARHYFNLAGKSGSKHYALKAIKYYHKILNGNREAIICKCYLLAGFNESEKLKEYIDFLKSFDNSNRIITKIISLLYSYSQTERELDLALELSNYLVKNNPLNEKYVSQKLLILLRYDDRSKFNFEISRLISKNPSNGYYLRMQLLYSYENKSMSELIRKYKIYLDNVNSNDTLVNIEYSKMLIRSKRYSEIVPYLKNILSIFPNLKDIKYKLAYCYEQTNQLNKIGEVYYSNG